MEKPIKALIFVKDKQHKEKILKASEQIYLSNPDNNEEGLDFFMSLHKYPDLIQVEFNLREL